MISVPSFRATWASGRIKFWCSNVIFPLMGARLRGRTTTHASKKGSEKFLERVMGKGSPKAS